MLCRLSHEIKGLINCSHEVKRLRLCAGDGKRTQAQIKGTNLSTHTHLNTLLQAVYTTSWADRPDTCTHSYKDTHRWTHTTRHPHTPTHQPTHSLSFTSPRWLVEAFIKKKQFHRNLWRAVFSCRLCVPNPCDSRPVEPEEDGETTRPFQRHEETSHLCFAHQFLFQTLSHCSVKCAI